MSSLATLATAMGAEPIAWSPQPVARFVRLRIERLRKQIRRGSLRLLRLRSEGLMTDWVAANLATDRQRLTEQVALLASLQAEGGCNE